MLVKFYTRQLDPIKAAEIVKYILSLTADSPDSVKIAIKGNLKLQNKPRQKGSGFYILEASYTDKGSESITRLAGTAKEILRYSTLYPEDFDLFYDMKIEDNLLTGTNEGYTVIQKIDLSGIRNAFTRSSGKGGYVEMRIDSLKGEQVGRFQISKDIDELKEISSAVIKEEGKHDLYLRYINTESRCSNVGIQRIQFKR